MLRQTKQILLRAVHATGLESIVAASPWRNRRLLILCYHGISLDEEHLWRPGLYLRPETFHRRLSWLRRNRYTVLSLAEGVARLRTGTLPPRAVALTFDDGFYDFLARGYPILREFEVPATLYLTTWHTTVPDPVPKLMLRYLLWKGRDSPAGSSLGVGTEVGREQVARNIEAEVAALGPGYAGWRERLPLLAERLGQDYAALQSARVLQFMRPAEIRSLDPSLVALELHTHRHRVPLEEGSFRREISDNRKALAALTGDTSDPTHFCYPSGVHDPRMLPWLRAEGIVSATTCEPGLASRGSHPLLFPRYLDGDAIGDAQFAAWASGINDLLPRRRGAPAPGSPLR